VSALPEPDSGRGPRQCHPIHPAGKGWCAVAIMIVVVLFTYKAPVLLWGHDSLGGGDFLSMHAARIRFAREALLGPGHRLPGWYPRELLGAPFWSNVQSFPFLPTRLPLLLLRNPWNAYGVAVNLAACLAALFTYAYARRVGLGRFGAALAGFTFAANGYFASRVGAGHLPLLEAYPALPLLLWLSERYLQSATPARGRLLAIALAAGCTALAGHPQIPAYALSIAALYLIVRGANRRAVKALVALLLGFACAGVVLWPLALLVGRSTRELDLEPSASNFPFYPERLTAFILPWHDGMMGRGFWDSVCYAGWLPVLCTAVLAGRLAWKRKWPSRSMVFLAVSGSLALLLALPGPLSIQSLLPGTLLRSPARQVYVTEFALAIGLGTGAGLLVNAVRRAGYRRTGAALGLVLAAAQVADLEAHDSHYVYTSPMPRATDREIDRQVRELAGDGRVASALSLANAPWFRQIDDVGFFDSISLARPYQGVLDLARLPPLRNVEYLSASELDERVLRYAAARARVTADIDGQNERCSPVTSAAARASFIPPARVAFVSDARMRSLLRDDAYDPVANLLLPPEAKAGAPGPGAAEVPDGGAPSVSYARPWSDEVRLRVRGRRAGYIRLIESWDPGWSATSDGRPVPIWPADGVTMAVAVDAGDHQIVFRYATPGVAFGAAISATAAVLLLAWVALGWPLKQASRQASSGL